MDHLMVLVSNIWIGLVPVVLPLCWKSCNATATGVPHMSLVHGYAENHFVYKPNRHILVSSTRVENFVRRIGLVVARHLVAGSFCGDCLCDRGVPFPRELDFSRRLV